MIVYSTSEVGTPVSPRPLQIRPPSLVQTMAPNQPTATQRETFGQAILFHVARGAWPSSRHVRPPSRVTVMVENEDAKQRRTLGHEIRLPDVSG